jgi:Competence protein CoiA-like family
MKKGLKLPFAVRGEALVHISEVTSGRQPDCLCPGCCEQLIARKGIKLAHHFAHDGGTNCSVETALHMLGKRLIHEGIQRALTGGTAIKLRWKCNQCPDEHDGNLLKRAATVKLEHDLGEARPDMLLLDASGKPVVAIEVVVTHAPEEAVRKFYGRQRIQLVRINLPDGAALEPLRDLSELSASFVSFCARKKCPKCQKPLTKRQLHIIAADCYRCHKPMRVAFVNAEGNAINPAAFTAKDIEFATKEGCLLKQVSSEKRTNSYLANACKNCPAFIGEHYMTSYWNDAPVAVLPAGFCCHDCNRDFPGTDS